MGSKWNVPMRLVPRLPSPSPMHTIQIREWQQVHRRPVFRADQREAQLAADSQNVHTREITQQMKDSINILLAVDVPKDQTGSVREMRVDWLEKRLLRIRSECSVSRRSELVEQGHDLQPE
jgi:hypothetical protein